MQNGTESGAIVAVGEARTALPSALETQTKAIGVIVPPPDIRVSRAAAPPLAAPQQLSRQACVGLAWLGGSVPHLAGQWPAADACSQAR